MHNFIPELVKRFLVLWFPFFMIAPAFGQEPESKEISPPEESPAAPSASPVQANPIQNATLEGIQISKEEGKEPGQSIITCYFIFRDKPSSYFYEKKLKAKKLVFDFSDTQKGTSPIPSTKEAPIEGFEIEQKKVDANRDVKGLNPEWHDMISVTFNLTAMPKFNVTDEYNVISFSYKWGTKKDIDDGGKLPPAGIAGIVGGGVLLVGVVGYLIWKPGGVPPPIGSLDTNDLPSH